MSEEIQSEWQFVLEELCSSGNRIDLSKVIDNKHRVEACFTDKVIYDVLYKWISGVSQRFRYRKIKEEAAECRKKGNSFYSKGNVLESLYYYTKAVLLAPKDSEELELAFGNRSAALFNLKKYKECVSDIKYALSNENAFNPRCVKILMRKAKALEHLKKYTLALEAYKLAEKNILGYSHEEQKKSEQLTNEIKLAIMKLNGSEITSSEMFPQKEMDEFKLISAKFISNTHFHSASSKLSLMKNEFKGRHVIATQELSAGEVLFLEKPFAFVILPTYSYERCQTCCRDISNPLPCEHCASACFCNEECRRIAWNKFHKWECGIGLHLNYMIGIAHLGFRVAITGFTNLNIPEYERVKKLQQHIDLLEPDDLYQYTLTATMLVVYLEKFTKMVMVPNRIDSLLEIGGSILLHIAQMICNGHAITDLRLTTELGDEKIFNEEQVRIATAIYPSASMMNHSCDPSIINGFNNEYLIVRAIKDIKNGEEVFNCYGPHFRRMERKLRIRSLLQQYMFLCQCEQCISEEDFIERFNGYRCQYKPCNRTILMSNSRCSKCQTLISENCIKSVNISTEKMQAAQQAAKELDFHKSVTLAEEALRIFSKYLYKNHKNVLECKDFLAKMLIPLGRYFDSYKYTEENIVGIEERYGTNSIEVANEIGKLSDIVMQLVNIYMEIDQNHQKDDDSKYREIFGNVLQYLKQARKIYKIHYGKMNPRFIDFGEQMKLLKSLDAKIKNKNNL